LPTFQYGAGMAVVKAYETKQGKRYRVRYRTPENRLTDKRGFRTKREAEAFANTVEVAKLRGEYVNPADARRTVDALGQAWLQRQKGHLKPDRPAISVTDSGDPRSVARSHSHRHCS
jgi:hypothetical protein